ncbi:uncharacterized protein LOC6561943 [Drosophila grimshawi]|uniref:GH11591 n=1 Tax=Drosophila grimshawi TaxID=7222 RepID=B4JBW7_DROGR|nr:uncharacterized protein LOC6561943 [Drosophila grimshawi]XP_032592616.1 uncharacterized protein LOC6561943 [Drosophila grimshawi]EDW04070.1 GH11591 [Drosophila grimshawi]
MTTRFAYIVLIALIANILSAWGLRCHQCNTHDNDDCESLRVNTPRAQLDDQYLKDCAPKDGQPPFCRKTIIRLEVPPEQRIVRSCGWVQEKMHNTCFTADNEGYKETICTCSDEGCNAAGFSSPGLVTLLAALSVSLGCAVLLRR